MFTFLTFIIAVTALVLAIVAFRRTGGMTGLKEEVDSLDSVTENLRERTANALEKMEKALRRNDKETASEGEVQNREGDSFEK